MPGDGVVTGFGRVDGRPVDLFAQDFTVLGGSLSLAHAEKICKVMDMAMKIGLPGDRLQRHRRGPHPGGRGLPGRLRRDLPAQHHGLRGGARRSRAIMGPCAGGAVYSPAITDFITMVRNTSYMFVTGPDVIKTVTHEDVTKDDLGGATAHGYQVRRGPLRCCRRADGLAHTRELLGFLPCNNLEDAAPAGARRDPSRREDPPLDTLVPDDPASPTTCTKSSGAWWTTALLRGAWRLRGQHRRRLRAHGRPHRGHRRQPAHAPGRGAGHRLPRRARASCASATPSTSP